MIPKTTHIPSLRRWLLGAVMHLANHNSDDVWYRLKKSLLLKYGQQEGYAVQTVKAGCWVCDGTGCSRCDNGVHHITRTKLRIWNVEGWIFHTPEASFYSQHAFDLAAVGAQEVIKDRIWKRHSRADNEAMLWLLLAYDWEGFLRSLYRCCYYHPLPYPLTTLQRVVYACNHLRYGLPTLWAKQRLALCISITRFLAKHVFPGGYGQPWQAFGEAVNTTGYHLELSNEAKTEEVPF